LKNELLALIAAAVVVAILVGVRLFGYAEFLLAKQRLITTTTSFLHLRSNGKAHASEVRLQGSANWKELWNGFVECAPELNLKRIHLDVNAPSIHEGYHARWNSPEVESENPNVWYAEMPLTMQGQAFGRLEITGRRDDEPIWKKIATLTKLVEEIEQVVSSLVERERQSRLRLANSGPHSRRDPAPIAALAAATNSNS
jgi:UDP-GlcNAc:undecaprenyl-phosphate GlcNAc-1-phosphate transferase